MKISTLTIALLFLSAAFTVSLAQNNFSGSWKRNLVLSNSNGLSFNSIPITIRIEQGDRFIFHSIMKDGKGNLQSQDDTVKIDDKPQIKINPKTKNKNVTSVTWSNDKKQLIYRKSGVDTTGKVIQDWIHTISLTPDGHLQIDVDITIEGSKYFLKEVFDKD